MSKRMVTPIEVSRITENEAELVDYIASGEGWFTLGDAEDALGKTPEELTLLSLRICAKMGESNLTNASAEWMRMKHRKPND